MISRTIKAIWISFFAGLFLLLLLIGAVRINLFGLFGELPGLEILENPESDEASVLFSEDGKILGSYFREKRTPVRYEDIPGHVIQTLVATEDERFEDHAGIDFKGTFAIFYYLIQGKKRGSSTISQQTAKNLFRLRDAEKYRGPLSGNMLITKIKEWTVAIQIERSYTKKEILTMYLNTVSFGRQTFGIKNAAETFFNVDTKDLTLNQGALLIGLLKGPSFYDPVKNPDAALFRRNTVLSQMVKSEFLAQSDRDKLAQESLGLDYHSHISDKGMAPYLKNYLRPAIQKWARENDQDLYGGGLKIYTTVNYQMQIYLEKAVYRHMKALQGQYNSYWKGKSPWSDNDFVYKLARKSSRYQEYKTQGLNDKEILSKMNEPVSMTLFSYGSELKKTISPMDSIAYMVQFLHTGALSVNPHNGRIMAYVGGIDGNYFEYDHVSQSRRQPGSTFKPFVYSYAMEEKGFTPCSEVLDVEVAYPWNGSVWSPQNSNHTYSNAPVNLKYGLANSVNSVAANLMMQSGPENIVSFARKFGLKGDMKAVPALALGTTDVSVFEMVSAYSVFANGGTYIEPYALLRIEDKYGNVLEEFRPKSVEVISEKTAYYMVELLKAGSEYGTSKRLKTDFGINAEIGGKTGTTQNSSDGWFIGISPELVTGVWVGGANRDIRIPGGQGASLALPIWGYYMKSVFTDSALDVDRFNYRWKQTMPSVNCEISDTLALPTENDFDHFLSESE